jgi:hypothetical protein
VLEKSQLVGIHQGVQPNDDSVAGIERQYPVEMPVAPGEHCECTIDFGEKEHVVRRHSVPQGANQALGNPFLARNGMEARANFASTIRPGRDITGEQFGQGGEVPD